MAAEVQKYEEQSSSDWKRRERRNTTFWTITKGPASGATVFDSLIAVTFFLTRRIGSIDFVLTSLSEKMIDLRSDTVTRPSKPMLECMMNAAVGDDVWGDDVTVNRLQETIAKMFGLEAALFCPSGTMTNQIAIKVHTQPGDEVIVSDTAHVKLYEGGGMAFNSGVQARAVQGDEGGRISSSHVLQAINADDVHYPRTSLVCLENTTNKGGGAFYSRESLTEISELCRSKGLKLHLDGARVFNSIVASGEYDTEDLGRWFDSISVCLSKGLGCPIGSILLGSSAFIHQAKRVRKCLGGGMRQAGYLAACGLYALDNNIERLSTDHLHAAMLAKCLAAIPWVTSVRPSPTNIVIFEVKSGDDAAMVKKVLEEKGILISSMAASLLRVVTHLDVSREDIEKTITILKSFII